MKKIFHIAIAAAALFAASSAPGSALAAPVDFILNNATATFNAGGVPVSLTGTFSFDPTSDALSAIDIRTSIPMPNHFDTLSAAMAASISGTSSLDNQLLKIVFTNPLDSASDPLFSVNSSGPEGNFGSVSVTGTADPVGVVTPIPPAVTLFGTALALFALMFYGRRNSRMRMSFSSVQRLA
jgi:hypothetical protein